MQQVTYLSQLLRYALRTVPQLVADMALSLFSVVVEILAMTSLFPIAALAAGQTLSDQSRFVRYLKFLHLTPDLRTCLQVFIVLFGLRIVTSLISQSLALHLGKKLHAKMSSTAFRNFITQYSVSEIERLSIGYFTSLAGDETFRASYVVTLLMQLGGQLFLAVLYFATIVFFSWKTGLAVLAFLIVTLLSLLQVFRKSQQLGARQIEESRDASTIFVDALNGLRAVRAFSAEAHVSDQYEHKLRRYTRTLFLIDFLSAFAKAAPAAMLLFLFLLFTCFNHQAFQNSLNIAFISTLIVLLMRFFPAAGNCLNTVLRLNADAKAGRDVTHVLDFKPSASGARSTWLKPIQQIEVNGLSFAYDPAVPVLDTLSLRFERGKSYALVGPSGCGKSTFLDLLLSFHDGYSGSIRLNGQPLGEIDPRALRARVILLGQQTTIFSDTLRANIALGADADDQAIQSACRLACLDEVVAALPEGLDTRLQYQGSNFSGGQRQRIGLARAVLRDPDVLIFDESTSALDVATREQVINRILEAFSDRIVIFVTHDPAVTSRADVVYDFMQLNAARRAS